MFANARGPLTELVRSARDVDTPKLETLRLRLRSVKGSHVQAPL